MKILVIPDVHLKPNMFVRAGELMRKGIADNAVCLMDIPDDWKKQYCIEEYERTLRQSLLQENILIHYGVTAIMIFRMYGMKEKADIAQFAVPLLGNLCWKNIYYKEETQFFLKKFKIYP